MKKFLSILSSVLISSSISSVIFSTSSCSFGEPSAKNDSVVVKDGDMLKIKVDKNSFTGKLFVPSWYDLSERKLVGVIVIGSNSRNSDPNQEDDDVGNIYYYNKLINSIDQNKTQLTGKTIKDIKVFLADMFNSYYYIDQVGIQIKPFYGTKSSDFDIDYTDYGDLLNDYDLGEIIADDPNQGGQIECLQPPAAKIAERLATELNVDKKDIELLQEDVVYSSNVLNPISKAPLLISIKKIVIKGSFYSDIVGLRFEWIQNINPKGFLVYNDDGDDISQKTIQVNSDNKSINLNLNHTLNEEDYYQLNNTHHDIGLLDSKAFVLKTNGSNKISLQNQEPSFPGLWIHINKDLSKSDPLNFELSVRVPGFKKFKINIIINIAE